MSLEAMLPFLFLGAIIGWPIGMLIAQWWIQRQERIQWEQHEKRWREEARKGRVVVSDVISLIDWTGKQ